jgi:hypothetical protein
MTASHTIQLAAHRSRSLLSRLPEAALTTLMFALVTGAWLAFFLVVPFDFTLPRPR